MAKKILLGLSTVHGISDLIAENLTKCGFYVVNACYNDRQSQKFKYPSFWSWLKVRFKRDILGIKEAKNDLEGEIRLKRLKQDLGKNEQLDYALFFLADNYSLDFIKYVRERTNKGGMVNYQWDGLDRFPRIYQRLPFFDRVYVFDVQDLGKADNLLPTTSFYFDFDLSPQPIVYDFYFLGGHRDDRMPFIVKFTEYAQQKNWHLNFNIVINPRDKHKKALYPSNVNFLFDHEAKEFRENLNAARQSRILLDFVISEHKGLSLRTFESIGYDKKLITTNAEVKKYDFYHPNNMFVLDNNFDELEAFLTKPYIELDPSIKKKYSFSNWVNYVLNIEPYQPILLPNEN
ncbi:hypothetical protein [Bibersteinia trehalosi]|uniref:hypothetical protein n=1 Tax=Bibersteinia trehalosi TaxID=47735 RepID=UPI002D76AE0E|nr:hypothetical protein [Bibersteinia trehalosi]